MRVADFMLEVFERQASDGTPVILDAETLSSLMRELRETRSLLATPLPCGWPKPEVVSRRSGRNAVAWEALEDAGDMETEDAIAIGAELIRAARQAQGRTW